MNASNFKSDKGGIYHAAAGPAPGGPPTSPGARPKPKPRPKAKAGGRKKGG